MWKAYLFPDGLMCRFVSRAFQKSCLFKEQTVHHDNSASFVAVLSFGRNNVFFVVCVMHGHQEDFKLVFPLI